MHKAYTGEELSDEQVLFLRHVIAGHNVLVDACIGSGKTFSINEACRRCRDKKIIYFTYNRRLMEEAKGKIKLENVEIHTYHSFAGKYLAKSGKRSKGVRYCLDNLVDWKVPIPSYDILIVDEYQDIANDMAKVLSYVKSQNPDIQIVFVGDMCQKIYDRVFDIKAFTRQLLGEYVRVRFTKCFRISSEYAQFLGRCWNKSIVGMNEQFKFEKTTSVEYVKSILSQNKPKDILVLGPNIPSKRNYLQNELEWNYGKVFNKYTLYSSIHNDDSFAGYRRSTENSAIFTTFDSSKGLERDICVVVGWSKWYFNKRKEHKTDPEVLRNIFLVAASRAKKHLIFLMDGTESSEDTKEVEKYDSDKILDADDFNIQYDNEPDLTACNIASMLQHKELSDIENCMQYITKQVFRTSGTKIKVQRHTGWIDLAPLIGLYTDTNFFTKHDMEKEGKLLERTVDKFKWDSNLSTIQKVKRVVAVNTGQYRYITGVSNSFISKEAEELIERRLKTVFTGDEEVQKECKINLICTKGYDKQLLGLCDVLTDGVVWELKFVRQIQPEHYIQLATYMIALNIDIGRLWNVYDNSIIEIRIANRRKFVSSLCTCISKHKLVCMDYKCG